jgi:hypothetical protein
MDPATVGAWCTGIASIIGAAAVLVKIVLTRPRLPVAEEILARMTEIEERLLIWAGVWHDAKATAALQGFELPELPERLRTPMHPGAPPQKGAET